MAESGSISPELRNKLADFDREWEQVVSAHVQQLKTLIGEARFQRLDEFVQSGKPMFDRPGAPFARTSK